MTPSQIVASLIAYGKKSGFFTSEDEIYVTNKLLAFFHEPAFQPDGEIFPIAPTMAAAIELGKSRNLAELDNLNEEDCFDAAIMDVMMPRPSQVIARFHQLYKKSPKEATDWYYAFSIASRYVRTDRLANNIVYKAHGHNCDLDITINLSKPEKDPKEIARLKTLKSSSYPLCALCKENEGFYGSYSQAGRSNHRIIPLKLNGEDFFLQYSPYGYYNEHCIVLKKEHVPMAIDQATFERLFDFLDLFPHYMIGSNADLPIVGGSILSHEHYQGGNYLFPLAKAPEGFHFKLAKFPKVEFGIVDWPMSVIRAKSTDRKELSNACDFILGRWRKYSDSKRFIIASDEQGNHNTITPIARYREEKYEIDLALRCNCVSAQYPDGIFHPHQEKHHIKKENIGLIEVMGLAILPGRLKTELALCEKQLLAMAQEPDPSIVKHMEWLKAVKAKHPQLTAANVEKILEAEVGLVFEGVLEDCGVFKRDEEGQGGFKAFLASLDK